MYRIFKVYLISFLILIGFTNHANSQIEQGTFCIDPYIGVPGEKTLFKINFPDPEINYTGWPVSIGTRFEYLLTSYIVLVSM